MNKTVFRDVERHAVDAYPRESCGLLVRINRRLRYRPCRNLAASADQFRLCPEDYAQAEDEGQIVAVVHSHPEASAAASEADRVGCEASGLPWHIVEVRRQDDGQVMAGEVVTIMPVGYCAPLVGRQFTHGVLDCLTLIQDFYRRELAIELPEYEREDEWWNKGQNLYMQHYEAAGFYPVASPCQGDLILMQIRADVPNHGGIFLADGVLRTEPHLHRAPGTLLHHLYGRDSRRDVYGGQWAEATRLILRHKDSPYA